MKANTASAQITKALAAIVNDDPFYAYLLLSRHIVEDSSIETASTDGKVIKYNPRFIETLNISQTKGLLKHEILHIAYMHHLRRNNRDFVKWNKATDYVINSILLKAGTHLPEGGLVDSAFDNMSAEAVYNKLPDDPQNNENNNQNWNWGTVEDSPDAHDAATRSELEQDVKTEIVNAHNAAKITGKLPAGLDRLIDEIQQSKMPWKTILARFFRSTTKADESWSKPNRRYVAHNVYLPSRHTNSLGSIVIAIDTSGSINTENLKQFFGCVSSILKHARPESIHLVYCDAAVASTQILTAADLPLKLDKFKPKGGGGTSFVPVFEYVDKNKLTPAALLYLTDMLGIFPSKVPPYPVIWCATTKHKGPFGKTIELVD